MPAPMRPRVLADPVGVMVELVTSREPALDRARVTDVVQAVAGGRAKRRRLAQALLDNPSVLDDGRSPAPRAIGDLLIALRQAGAAKISPPICAACAKPLRTLQRRGERWYCGVCGSRSRTCASCGQTKVVKTVDRRGQPRCAQCPDSDQRDALEVISKVVTDLDPSLSPRTVVSAARRVFSRYGQLRRLAWALEERPGLLTGQGAQAPMPGVLRLIDELRAAGSRNVTLPTCPGCDRVIRLHRRIEGRWLCRNCVARSRAQPCARCGAVREIGGRDENGRPLCPTCLLAEPANQEICADCGRKRPVSTRGLDGPLCESCRPWKTLSCGICGRSALCVISQATGTPWCRGCKQRWARCSGCGQTAPIRGGTRDAPLCSICTRPEPGFWRRCPRCGREGQLRPVPCARCLLEQRLRQLFGDENGEIRPGLRALHQALITTDKPSTVDSWLRKSTVPAILRDLEAADRALTHQTLDELPAGQSVEHLRSVLVAIGALPRRDEHMIRLERWTARVIAQRSNTDERKLLHRYAEWHVIRRLRGRLGGAETTGGQATVARQHIPGAIVVLDWLAAHGLTLSTAGQGDLEAWLTSPETTHRSEVGSFIRWARRHKLTRLDFAAIRWDGPVGNLDNETRWQQARWLLHDGTVKPEDRLAGLLVLLYAQWPAAISRLTLDHLDTAGDEVRIHLGREPLVLPEPVADLARQLVQTRQGHAVIGDHGRSSWLFPGGQPGRPISAARMTQRLRELGIRSSQAVRVRPHLQSGVRADVQRLRRVVTVVI